ncbi:MAG: hypothetical protein WCO28_12680 [Bacteroidota bacterium]
MKTKLIRLNIFSLLSLTFFTLNVFGQGYIEITITHPKNYPNQTIGQSVNSTDTVQSHDVNFNIQNQRLHSILHHFHARKYRPSYSSVYRTDATTKLKPSLINNLKKIYRIECISVCRQTNLNFSLRSVF